MYAKHPFFLIFIFFFVFVSWGWSQTEYTFEVALDAEAEILTVSQTIAYVNTSDIILESIYIIRLGKFLSGSTCAACEAFGK